MSETAEMIRAAAEMLEEAPGLVPDLLEAILADTPEGERAAVRQAFGAARLVRAVA